QSRIFRTGCGWCQGRSAPYTNPFCWLQKDLRQGRGSWGVTYGLGTGSAGLAGSSLVAGGFTGGSFAGGGFTAGSFTGSGLAAGSLTAGGPAGGGIHAAHGGAAAHGLSRIYCAEDLRIGFQSVIVVSGLLVAGQV